MLTLTEKSRRLEQRQAKLDEERTKQSEQEKKRQAQLLRLAGSMLRDIGALKLRINQLRGAFESLRDGIENEKTLAQWEKRGAEMEARAEQERSKERVPCVIHYLKKPNGPTIGALRQAGLRRMTDILWAGQVVRREAEEIALGSGGTIQDIGGSPPPTAQAAD